MELNGEEQLLSQDIDVKLNSQPCKNETNIPLPPPLVKRETKTFLFTPASTGLRSVSVTAQWAKKIMPVGVHATTLVITRATKFYHQLARCLVTPSDHAIEIGSAYGDCTAILAQKAATALGIDISEEKVVESRKRFPSITFKLMDAILDTQQLLESTRGCTVLFIDINGNRLCPAVCHLIDFVKTYMSPTLIVVKSQELHQVLANDPTTTVEPPTDGTFYTVANADSVLMQEAEKYQKLCVKCGEGMKFSNKFSLCWPSLLYCTTACCVASGGEPHQLRLSNKKWAINKPTTFAMFQDFAEISLAQQQQQKQQQQQQQQQQ